MVSGLILFYCNKHVELWRGNNWGEGGAQGKFCLSSPRRHAFKHLQMPEICASVLNFNVTQWSETKISYWLFGKTLSFKSLFLISIKYMIKQKGATQQAKGMRLDAESRHEEEWRPM